MRVLSLLVLLGCPPLKHARPDADGDGYNADEDCDDASPAAAPNAVETCDGVDNDCDGVIDDGAQDTVVMFPDLDADGYGATAGMARVCPGTPGYAGEDGDCDDDNAGISPTAEELCNGADDDCDAETDEGDATDAVTGWLDVDADGWGDGPAITACGLGAEYVTINGDCDDNDATRSPDAADICDGINNDCDDETDEDAELITWYGDGDGDGYGDSYPVLTACGAPAGWVSTAGDCDDNNDRIGPAAIEVCDGVDNDCEGTVDIGALGTLSVWPDSDGDSYGDANAAATIICSASAGYVENDDDCDDAEPAIAPGVVEACDGVDNDCNGLIDDGAAGLLTLWPDADGDGYGDAAAAAVTSCGPLSAMVENADDCDDTSALASPVGVEECDGYDNDCDGTTDVGVTNPPTWYADSDGDGYGDNGAGTVVCSPPPGSATLSGDCDDGDPAINPGEAEACDALDVDEDCDGFADDLDDGPAGSTAWYLDLDSDGYGAGAERVACDNQPGEVALSGDCDDTTSAIHPAQLETCDGSVDEDCDGLVDDADSDVSGTTSYFDDSDGDGWGPASSQQRLCVAPDVSSTRPGDCDDTDSLVQPGGTEICGGADEDCDGLTDDDDPSVGGTTTWYADVDSDGYGGDFSAQTCLAPAGAVSDNSDCDDAAAATSPAGTEVCGGSDEDCDGATDDDDLSVTGTSTWYLDDDLDGFGSGATIVSCIQPAGTVTNTNDCDDTRSDVNPAAGEVCDGDTDEDCDSLVDDADSSVTGMVAWYPDADGDGYGTGSVSYACSVAAASNLDGDCDDSDARTAPDQPERCNLIDDDCDPSVSEDGSVSVDGDGAYPSIQAAIDAASSGSTVQICAGTYYETLEVGADLTLNGSLASAGGAVVDGGGAGATLEVTAGSVTVYDLVFQGGIGRDYDGDGVDEGGNVLHAGSALHLERVTVSGGVAAEGAGVLVATGSVTLVDTDIMDNDASLTGGGLWVAGGVICAVTRGSLSGNNSDVRGGGVSLQTSASCSISDTEIGDNSSGTGGGAHVEDSGSLLVAGGSWMGNTAAIGGALAADGSAVVSATDVLFQDNTATTRGGAIYTFYSSLDLSGASFEGNLGSDGGAIYAAGGDSIVASTTFSTNAGSQRGGAICADVGHDATFTSSTLTLNTSFSGAAVYVGSNSYVVDDSSTWTNNSSTLGGAVYVSSGSDAAFTSSVMSGNTASFGGAWFIESTGEVDMYGGRLDSNTASTYGGGAYLRDSARFYSYSTDLGGSTYPNNSPDDVYLTAGGGSSYDWNGLTSVYCSNSC